MTGVTLNGMSADKLSAVSEMEDTEEVSCDADQRHVIHRYNALTLLDQAGLQDTEAGVLCEGGRVQDF